jgi:CheY-like chemotaxis protein
VKILYVEDNPANLYLVKRVAQDHEVINYIDGEEALANFEQDRPDLVLMDIQLSGHLSGLDVVRKLRESGHKVPIVAVTAYAMVGDRERALAAGCDDYMAKPLPIPQFVRLIEHYNQQIEAAQGAVDAAQPQAPAGSTGAGSGEAEKAGEDRSEPRPEGPASANGIHNKSEPAEAEPPADQADSSPGRTADDQAEDQAGEDNRQQ